MTTIVCRHQFLHVQFSCIRQQFLISCCLVPITEIGSCTPQPYSAHVNMVRCLKRNNSFVAKRISHLSFGMQRNCKTSPRVHINPRSLAATRVKRRTTHPHRWYDPMISGAFWAESECLERTLSQQVGQLPSSMIIVSAGLLSYNHKPSVITDVSSGVAFNWNSAGRWFTGDHSDWKLSLLGFISPCWIASSRIERRFVRKSLPLPFVFESLFKTSRWDTQPQLVTLKTDTSTSAECTARFLAPFIFTTRLATNNVLLYKYSGVLDFTSLHLEHRIVFRPQGHHTEIAA